MRHSLFRPPHSVGIFTYEEMKEVIQFWVEHFLRFYEEYEECFRSKLEETLNAVSFPQRTGTFRLISDKENSLQTGKAINKDLVLNMI